MDTYSPKIFFFLPSTTDTIEDTNNNMNSINLIPIDIKPSKFGADFGPSSLDFANADREKYRESMLKVLKKIVDLSHSNLQKNVGLTEIRTFYGSVENEYLKINLLFPNN